MVELITENVGKVRPDSLEDYLNASGYEALKKAFKMTPEEIIEEVKKSNLRGRGGAGYPTGSKWEQLHEIDETPKYIVCNADEGEPGTFKDKIIMDKDPFKLVEAMTIAGYTFGSNHGYIYIRGEYPLSKKTMQKAVDLAKEAGYLGDNILGTDYSFDIHIRTGAGAYVCGENSAQLNSLEGKVGRPRIKPPHLAEVGLFKKPTLVNNVESFAAIPYIVLNGGEKYASFGTKESGGTKLVCLSGNVVNRGVYEVPFGTTIREIIYDLGGGMPEGRKFKFAQIGGSSGPCFGEDKLDTPLCYKETGKNGLIVGSGALLVVDDSNCAVDFAKCISEFFVHESCGKCTMCREGNRQLLRILTRFTEGKGCKEDFALIEQLSNVLPISSFCGLGETATRAVSTCIELFRDEFEEHIEGKCRAGICSFSEGGK
ncbi:MAG TPA: NADH-quinone oxidoreductase subunit F [Thermoanaerobacterales bacterium]|nr:NADH-quinone oxidoreductase subunit F [Thermoanaerobacterales bacterium]